MPRHDNDKQQGIILAHAWLFVLQHQYSPLINELAQSTGMSRETVRRHLYLMQEQGVLTVGDGPRMLALHTITPRATKELMSQEHQALVDEAAKRLSVLLPNVSPARLTEVAEAVAKAVERQNAVEDQSTA